MGKKATKASRKYAASGQLKKEIQQRKKHQQVKRNIDRRKSAKKAKGGNAQNGTAQGGRSAKGRELASEDEDEGMVSGDESESKRGESSRFKGMSVDDFLNGGFMQGASDDEDGEGDEDSEDEGGDDDASFASVDELEDEALTHKHELAKLAEKDPEFYEYLQENDKELLDFDVDGVDDEDMDDGELGGDDDEKVEIPLLTKEIVQRWQKALLQQRSLKALRRLLIAFRSAAHMNEDDVVHVWTINSPSVYEKLVSTTLRYTPVVLDHHVPYKILPDGKFKPPTQTKKLQTLQKLILSHFYNLNHLIEQLTDHDTLFLAVSESAKIVPYVVSSRKAIKVYLKMCLNLWSSADDDIRIASFLAIRRLSMSGDEAIKELVLKKTYLALVRSSKTTNAHTLPSINLMKNSASELYSTDHALSYQHAYGYMRQLAVHLRNSLKVKSKESYKLVYNWQYVHSVDFWSIVLAKACSTEAVLQRGGQESELQGLIYPLTQVTLGAIKLISSSRCYPFHLSLIRSLVHIQRHTETYIPLVPYLLPIITTSLSPTLRPKSSTLKPIDLETHIRAPAQYQRTRVYLATVLEDAAYLLAEWLSTKPVQGSIGFPEIVVPLCVMLRKSLKRASGGKEAGIVKGVLERVEEGARSVEERRKNVRFGPKLVDEVRAWERSVDLEETPIGKYVKSQRKVREKRRKLIEKARLGGEETLEDS